MSNYTVVEITLEFDHIPTKDDVYACLNAAMLDHSLRYDIEDELDAQFEKALDNT